LLGIGLLGPYIALFTDPSKINEQEIFLIAYEFIGINLDPLTSMGLFLITIFAIRTVSAIYVNRLILSYCRDIQISLRTSMMKSYQSMNYQKFISYDSSDAISNITILTMYFTNNVLYMTLKASAELLLAFFIISFLFFINPVLVLILIGGLFLLIISYSSFFKNLMSSYGKKINLANARAIQAVKQALEGLKEIRVLGKENFFYNRLEDNSKQYANLHANSVLITTASKYFIEFSVMTFFIVIISASSFFISSETSNVLGVIGMFAFAAIRLLPGVTLVSSAILQLRAHKNTVDRLFDALQDLNLEVEKEKLIKVEDYYEPQKGSIFKSISLEDITYSYPSSKKDALTNISMRIEKGESIGIIGASGSGKTTLVDIFLGLLKPDAGTISLNDKPMQDNLDSWRKMTAYIPQETLMINESLKSNIKLSEKFFEDDEKKLSEIIAQAKLEDVVKNLPEGIESNLGEGGIKLSGGQRQRVSLARAIFHSRELLVFDEATSALDMETEDDVMQEIKKIKGSKTLILIAHRQDTLRFCDRIYELKDGKVINEGTPKEILNNIN
tara:strand:+ start:17309 stop:18985 length:1677 start_codon:yes stop_codon:yes gene_type:complete